MAKGERAFWSSLPGILTGLAGILTAAVALLGLGLSQGWIGDGGGGDGSVDAGGEVVRISVEPETVSLRRLPLQDPPKATVEVVNDGTAPVTLEAEITGDDAGQFTSDGTDCTTSPLPPGRTCEVTVTFQESGEASATLVISANGGELAREVELEGKVF
ncbi:MAG TPA: choice-of-anchor D domain-containing protein [Acidimicrobiales bacterium]|nr:choice-of-anchor D domain-containing protein [Acidimicrobiales bacterium]